MARLKAAARRNIRNEGGAQEAHHSSPAEADAAGAGERGREGG
jgi:hypothetical protein